MPRARLSEFDPHAELLTTVADRLAGVMQAVIAAAGVKPRPVQPLPRPQTAVDRLRVARRRDQHRHLVGLLLPPQPQEGGDP